MTTRRRKRHSPEQIVAQAAGRGRDAECGQGPGGGVAGLGGEPVDATSVGVRSTAA